METHISILLNAGLVGYATAILAAFTGLGAGSRRSFNAGRRLALLSALFHIALMADLGVHHAQCPVMNVFGFVLLLSILVLLVAAASELFLDMAGLTVMTAPVAFVFAFFAAALGETSRTTPEGAATLAASVHIGVTLLSFALFALSFVFVLLYLFERGQLKQGAPLKLDFLPPLQTLYDLGHRFMGAGLLLLVLGTVSGILLARTVPNPTPHDWKHDPKVIATMATCAAYAAAFLFHFIPSLKGRRTAWACVGAFLLLILGLWASSLLSPLHNFR